MNFFNKLKDSIYSPKFYSEISKTNTSSALKYFFALVVLVVALTLFKSVPQFLFELPNQLKSAVASVSETYPKDLEVNIKSGRATSNVKEPYFLSDKSGGKFAVIDTKTSYSEEVFNNFGANIWLTSDTVFYKDETGAIKGQSLSQIGDVVINKDFINALVNKVNPWIPYFGPILLLITYLFLTFFYTLRLVYAFFLALLVLLTAKIMKVTLDYKGAYKVAIYSMTLALIVDDLKVFVGWTGFPLMFTVISLGVVVVNFAGIRRIKK